MPPQEKNLVLHRKASFEFELLDRFEAAGITSAESRPDTCCVNVYEAGSWLPPHVDSEAFDRPFCTLSLLSQQEAIFGETIDGEAGAWLKPVSDCWQSPA